MKWDIDQSIKHLEKKLYPAVSGIQISRVLLDVELLEQCGIKLKKKGLTKKENISKQSLLVWCMSFGKMNEPKVFLYGLTIKSVFEKIKKHQNKSV